MKINGVISVGQFVFPAKKNGFGQITSHIFDFQMMQN